MGETYQREMEDGTRLYVEQMCHKPGIVGYLLEGKNNEWRSYGQFLFNAGLAGVNTFSASREGDFFIEFEDGVKYRLGCPNLNISNLIMGQHAMNVLSGHSLIEDLTNKINGLEKRKSDYAEEIRELQTRKEALTTEIANSQSTKQEMISKLMKRIEDLSNDFAKMLSETLSNMRDKINAANEKWMTEQDTT